MMQLNHRLLYEAEIDLAPPIDVGPGPDGHRFIFHVTGGTLSGPRLKGRFLPGGGDWARIRSDGSVALDVRAAVETDDGACIYLTYGGRIIAPPELLGSLADLPNAKLPDPSSYYFRILPLFETGSPDYAWLNNVCAVGVGRITNRGVAYRVYEIL
jgi:hypothetical protein